MHLHVAYTLAFGVAEVRYTLQVTEQNINASTYEQMWFRGWLASLREIGVTIHKI